MEAENDSLPVSEFLLALQRLSNMTANFNITVSKNVSDFDIVTLGCDSLLFELENPGQRFSGSINGISGISFEILSKYHILEKETIVSSLIFALCTVTNHIYQEVEKLNDNQAITSKKIVERSVTTLIRLFPSLPLLSQSRKLYFPYSNNNDEEQTGGIVYELFNFCILNKQIILQDQVQLQIFNFVEFVEGIIDQVNKKGGIKNNDLLSKLNQTFQIFHSDEEEENKNNEVFKFEKSEHEIYFEQFTLPDLMKSGKIERFLNCLENIAKLVTDIGYKLTKDDFNAVVKFILTLLQFDHDIEFLNSFNNHVIKIFSNLPAANSNYSHLYRKILTFYCQSERLFLFKCENSNLSLELFTNILNRIIEISQIHLQEHNNVFVLEVIETLIDLIETNGDFQTSEDLNIYSDIDNLPVILAVIHILEYHQNLPQFPIIAKQSFIRKWLVFLKIGIQNIDPAYIAKDMLIAICTPIELINSTFVIEYNHQGDLEASISNEQQYLRTIGILILDIAQTFVKHSTEVGLIKYIFNNMIIKSLKKIQFSSLSAEENLFIASQFLEFSLFQIINGKSINSYLLFSFVLPNMLDRPQAPLKLICNSPKGLELTTHKALLHLFKLLLGIRESSDIIFNHIIPFACSIATYAPDPHPSSIESYEKYLLQAFDKVFSKRIIGNGFNIVMNLNTSYLSWISYFSNESGANSNEVNNTKRVFFDILSKSNRDELRTFISISKNEQFFALDVFKDVRTLLLSQEFNFQNFSSLVEVLDLILSILRKDVQSAESEVDEEFVAKETELETQAINTLLPCLKIITTNFFPLFKGKLSKASHTSMISTLNNILLYKTLYRDELIANIDKPAEEILKVSVSRLSGEISNHQSFMKSLITLCHRIKHIRPKFSHVRTRALQILHHFLSSDVNKYDRINIIENENDEIKRDREAKNLKDKIEELDEYISKFQENIEEKERLLNCGYGFELFDPTYDISITIASQIRQSVDFHYRNELVACFEDYKAILKDLSIKNIKLNNAVSVSTRKIFLSNDNEPLSLDEIKSRRSAIIKAINSEILVNKNIPSDVKQNIFILKQSLLDKEQQIEFQYSNQKPKTTTFQHIAKFSSNFFDCVSSCTSSFSGCYVANGDHCEKPIEVGINLNASFISIYGYKVAEQQNKGKDKEKKEINLEEEEELENVEVVYTDQGMFVFKAYCSIHSHDTSFTWVTLFQSLIQSYYVPAIILPPQFPTPKAFSLLQQFIEPEYTTTAIDFRDPFFADPINSYYDLKIEKILPGYIVLTRENIHLIKLANTRYKMSMGSGISMLTSSGLRTSTILPTLSNQMNDKLDTVTDISSSNLKIILSQLKAGNKLGGVPVDAFGKYIVLYIRKILDECECDTSILEIGFDINRYQQRNKKNRKQNQKILEKSEIINIVISEINTCLLSYYQFDQLEELFDFYQLQFFEVRKHLNLLKSLYNNKKFNNNNVNLAFFPSEDNVKLMLSEIQRILHKNIVLIPFSAFERDTQLQLIKWIYYNEDKVWRERGGRPGEETIESFLSFINMDHPSKEMQETELEFISPYDLDKDYPPHYGYDSFAGIVAINKSFFPQLFENVNITITDRSEKLKMKITGREVVAYSIGDYSSPISYEVVTAWTDPNWRSMNLAVKLYFETMKYLNTIKCKYFVFDILEGSLDRTCSGNPILSWIYSNNYHRFLLKRKLSYQSVTSSELEQFEKISVNLNRLFLASNLLYEDNFIRRHKNGLIITGVACSVAAVATFFYYRNKKE